MAGKNKDGGDRRITSEMLGAAGKIHSQLGQWKASEDALRALRDALPGHGPVPALVKTATVNGLYGTNVYAQVRMAEHVSWVMKEHEKSPRSDEDLVEELSVLPAEGDIPERRHTSFASKYAHFFICKEGEDRFPIYDSVAIRMVRWHLAKPVTTEVKERPYAAFCGELKELKEKNNLDLSNHDLDHYLWLAGLYRQWQDLKSGAEWKGNAELGRLFKDPTPEKMNLLGALLSR